MPLVPRVAVIHSQLASRISWHAHEHFEMLYLTAGATSYEFDDGRTVELPGGHFLMIPPGVRHRGVLDVRHPVRLCGVMLNPQSRRALQKTPLSRKDLTWLHSQYLAGGLTVCRMNSELHRLVSGVSQMMSRDTSLGIVPLQMAMLRLNLCAILMETARQSTYRGLSKTTRAVTSAQKFMQDHLSQSISMKEVAAAAKCSRARLFVVFKESTGMTPNHFLMRLRIKQAQATLAHSQQSITEIAMNCGFSTSQYFSTVFRKYTGSAPHEFRQQQLRSAPPFEE